MDNFHTTLHFVLFIFRKIKPKPNSGLSLSLNRSRSADDFNNRTNRTTSSNSNSNGSGGGGGIFFTTKSCASCGHPLGLFLSRGYVCHKCGFKVCKKCKIYEQNSSGWSCMKCTRNLWKKGVSGDWMADGGRNDGSRVKRSWSISGPESGNGAKGKAAGTGSSPILKSYVQYNVEDDKNFQFQFHSLPRMPTGTGSKIYVKDATQKRFPENPNHAQGAEAKRRSHSTSKYKCQFHCRRREREHGNRQTAFSFGYLSNLDLKAHSSSSFFSLNDHQNVKSDVIFILCLECKNRTANAIPCQIALRIS